MNDTALLSTLDATTPGGVYLCQVGPAVSCGACCGLYNMADPSRRALTRCLVQRSRRFADVPRTAEKILAFAAAVAATEKPSRPLPTFHHCPFVGLIGEPPQRIGCLLHPAATGNRGVDYRGLSYWGGMACGVYFCPTHRRVKAEYRRIARLVIDDWYLYGLVITEAGLLQAIGDELQARLAMPLDETACAHSPHLRQVLGRLLRLKCHWPFRRQSPAAVVNYFFEDGQYPRPPMDAQFLEQVNPRYAAIFRALDSRFASSTEFTAARDLLDRLFDAV